MVEERKGPSRINQQWKIPDYNQNDSDIEDLSDGSNEETPYQMSLQQDLHESSKQDDEVDLLAIQQKSVNSQDTQIIKNFNSNYAMRNYQQTQQSNQEQSSYYKVRKTHPNRSSQQMIIDLNQYEQAPVINKDKSHQSLESLDINVIIHDKCQIFKSLIQFNQGRLMTETEHMLSKSHSSFQNGKSDDSENDQDQESFDYEGFSDKQIQIDRNLNIESSLINKGEDKNQKSFIKRFQTIYKTVQRRPTRKLTLDKQSLLSQLEHQHSNDSELLLQMRKFNVKLLEYPIMLSKVFDTLDKKTIILDGELMRHIAGYDRQYHLRYIQLTSSQIKIYKNQVKSIYKPHPTVIIELNKVLCAKRIQEQTNTNDEILGKYDMYQFEIIVNQVKEDLSNQQSSIKKLKRQITQNSNNAFTFNQSPARCLNVFEQTPNQEISINLEQIRIQSKHQSQKPQLSATKTFRPKKSIKLDEVIQKPLIKDVLSDNNLLVQEMINNLSEFIEIPKQIEVHQRLVRSRSRSKSIDLPASWSNKKAQLEQSMQRFIFACQSDEEADRWVTIINSVKFLQKNLEDKQIEQRCVVEQFLDLSSDNQYEFLTNQQNLENIYEKYYQFKYYYDAIKDQSIKSSIIELTRDDAIYLKSGIIERQDLKKEIQECIQSLGGQVFFKMRRSPKDAFTSIDKTINGEWTQKWKVNLEEEPQRYFMRIQTVQQLELLCKNSQRIQEDLSLNDDQQIVLREFIDLKGWEFRCFVCNGNLNGVTIQPNQDISNLDIDATQKFFNSQQTLDFLRKIEYPHAVIDINMNPEFEITIIEINPYGKLAQSGKFSWVIDRKILNDGLNTFGEVTIRII
ncbi:cell division cycle protein 123-like protein [Stylonychia lemnae]|uniref:Cell division cycle protein 123-like protein n=1 Tax=Stylonychia lemnae TaxID=5949 RepID=A0A078AXD7_STYLE|nr:cell division cycle protein 123-like protein [Stylonychia lemnae]|eukprot:CDW85887.1 cell division cycle protein 123-like protein [Stylonychia lemnae]